MAFLSYIRFASFEANVNKNWEKLRKEVSPNCLFKNIVIILILRAFPSYARTPERLRFHPSYQ